MNFSKIIFRACLVKDSELKLSKFIQARLRTTIENHLCFEKKAISSLTRQLLIFGLVIFLTPLSVSAQEKNAVFTSSTNEKQQNNFSKARYIIKKTEKNSNPISEVFIGEKKVITFTQIAGGLSPEKRAQIIMANLNEFIEKGENPENIIPTYHNGIAVGKINNKILFTADVKSAKSRGMSVSELVLIWTNNIREALGVEKIIRDFDLVSNYKSISPETHSQKYFNYAKTGIASWYGGFFHGRTAADGSIYNKREFTAAHKTLPFGSIVKVTNFKNNRSCIVKITDRGPFIEGRIIDLSERAAEEIGISGISKVKIQVLGTI